MGAPEDNQKDLTAFEPKLLEDLTIQDVLIISALYAVQADTEKCKQVKIMAQAHPLFAEKPEDTAARVNKFTNWMQAKHPLKAVQAAANDLKPEHRKQAFEFAAAAALADNGLTEKKKNILQTLATNLAIDNEFVGRKLAEIERKEG
jgi:hypothetical protein